MPRANAGRIINQGLRVKTITKFPHKVTVTEDCWIPMPDGIKLAVM